MLGKEFFVLENKSCLTDRGTHLNFADILRTRRKPKSLDARSHSSGRNEHNLVSIRTQRANLRNKPLQRGIVGTPRLCRDSMSTNLNDNPHEQIP
jgi:hypothetical protein